MVDLRSTRALSVELTGSFFVRGRSQQLLTFSVKEATKKYRFPKAIHSYPLIGFVHECEAFLPANAEIMEVLYLSMNNFQQIF